MKAWLPQRIVGGLRPGSRLRFEDRNPGVGAFDGEVLAYEPPHLLELRWGTDVLRFEIEKTASGCDLILTDRISELGKASRDEPDGMLPRRARRRSTRKAPRCRTKPTTGRHSMPATCRNSALRHPHRPPVLKPTR